MSTHGYPLHDADTAKGHEGDGVISQWRVAIDAYKQMCGFLKLSPDGMRFTESSRESIRANLRRLAECIGQMDAGQRGKGVSFDDVPHVMARICAGCMLMELSGALDSLAVDDG